MRLRQFLFSTLVALSLSGCANLGLFDATSSNNDTTEAFKLSELKGLSLQQNKKKDGATSSTDLRMQAIRETALSIGAQAGLAERSKAINDSLEAQASRLDRIFNFNALMLEHNVLPPVLTEADQNLHLASNEAIRFSDKAYRIQAQARFVTTAPSWRNYLLLEFNAPEIPDGSLLPKTAEEGKAWEKFISDGWYEGYKQADNIYKESLHRLTRDMKGMVIYRRLLAQRMVSVPWVAKTELGVTGNSQEMSINDKVLRITALPALNTNADSWQPAVAK